MTTSVDTIKELLERKLEREPPKTDHCSQHAAVKITERSIDCPMCAADMRELLRAAEPVNNWLCKWQDDAKAILAPFLQVAPAPAPVDPDAVAIDTDVAEETLDKARHVHQTINGAFDHLREAQESVTLIRDSLAKLLQNISNANDSDTAVTG